MIVRLKWSVHYAKEWIIMLLGGERGRPASSRVNGVGRGIEQPKKPPDGFEP